MGSFSIWHWLVVLVIVLLFFGAGRLPNVMGDLAKGIKNFKAGLKDGDKAPDAPTAEPPKAIAAEPGDPATSRSAADRDNAARS